MRFENEQDVENAVKSFVLYCKRSIIFREDAPLVCKKTIIFGEDAPFAH